MNVREVKLDIGAILATKQGVALELVAQLGLVSPFALGILCGIRIESSKCIGLLHSESRQVVYV